MTADDYLPRVNLKNMFPQPISSTDERAIKAFSEKYVIDVKFIVEYVKQLELLDLQKLT